MSIKIFSLDRVDPEEADEIRILLNENRIRFYETPPGNWGYSQAAIWLEDDTQIEKAHTLISNYQIEREKKAKIKYEKAVSSGKIKTFLQVCIENPLRTIIFSIVFLIILVMYLIKVIEHI